MSQGLVERQYLQDIGDAIRSKNSSSDTYTPAEMAQAISGIHTADEVVLVQKTVNSNGQYNASDDSADGYSGVSVNVPNSYSASDEGKVVSNGDLIAQTSKNINANGTHDTTTNNSVVVNVPNSYAASDEGKVVSSGALVEQTSRNVTANGTYDTTENNEITVNVEGGADLTLPRFIDSIYCGTSDAPKNNAIAVRVKNHNGCYVLIAILHRTSSFNITLPNLTVVDLKRQESTLDGQYITVVKGTLDSDNKVISITTNESDRLAACLWVSEDDFNISYNKTITTSDGNPSKIEMQLNQASFIVAQAYYSFTTGGYHIPISTADVNLCRPVTPTNALRLFTAIVLRPYPLTMIGISERDSIGDVSNEVRINNNMDYHIYNIELA